MRPWSSPRRSPDAASRLRLGALGAAGPLACVCAVRGGLGNAVFTDRDLGDGLQAAARGE